MLNFFFFFLKRLKPIDLVKPENEDVCSICCDNMPRQATYILGLVLGMELRNVLIQCSRNAPCLHLFQTHLRIRTQAATRE